MTEDQVIIGMDPHKSSNTIAVLARDETMLVRRRFAHSDDGFVEMLDAVAGSPVVATLCQRPSLFHPAIFYPVSFYLSYFLLESSQSAPLSRLDPALPEAAQTLGASPIRTFFTVIVGSLRNAIVASFVMVFVFTLGVYLLPQILGRPRHWTLSVLITDQAIYQTNMPLTLVFSLIQEHLFLSLRLIPNIDLSIPLCAGGGGRRHPRGPRASSETRLAENAVSSPPIVIR